MSGRVEVVPGGHVVSSVDGVLVVVAHREPEAVTADSRAVTVSDVLLGLVAEAAARETRRTGRTFARLVANWLMSREDEDEVEFGVLTPGSRGMAVFLHGGVTAVLEHGDRREVLHGRDAGFSVDRMVIPAPAQAAGVFVDETSPREELPEPGVWSLNSGRMPGAGAVVWFGEGAEKATGRGAVARVRVAKRAAEMAARAAAQLMQRAAEEPGTDELSVIRPEPPLKPIAAEAERGTRGTVVRGFKCSHDHLNDPRVSFCSVCGIRMDQVTCVRTEGVRPPLGVLMLDDGTSWVLDGDLVIGRDPERSDQVRRGATPVRIADASAGMSRVHAEIRLAEWDITVVDRGSANGTHIRTPTSGEWVRAIPGHPTVLAPGSQILLGGRVFTVDSPHGHV